MQNHFEQLDLREMGDHLEVMLIVLMLAQAWWGNYSNHKRNPNLHQELRG